MRALLQSIREFFSGSAAGAKPEEPAPAAPPTDVTLVVPGMH
jgi:hypothetical protein